MISFYDLLTLDSVSFSALLRSLRPYPFAHVQSGAWQAPHGTTIIACRAPGGGRHCGRPPHAQWYNCLQDRDIEKVHVLDQHTLMGVAGATGVGDWMSGLLEVELSNIVRSQAWRSHCRES